MDMYRKRGTYARRWNSAVTGTFHRADLPATRRCDARPRQAMEQCDGGGVLPRGPPRYTGLRDALRASQPWRYSCTGYLG